MLLGSVIPILFERLCHRELRALASEDHAWADALRCLTRKVELGEDELARPAYPVRERGERLDSRSHFPCEAEHLEMAGIVLPDRAAWTAPLSRVTEGVLEDLFHPSSEDAGTNYGIFRTRVYKTRPLPLRCELCDVERDSYASFTEHCLPFKHKVLLSPPTFDPRVKDPRFQDPRRSWHGDGYAALSTMAKFKAIHRYREVMLEFFRTMRSERVGHIGMGTWIMRQEWDEFLGCRVEAFGYKGPSPISKRPPP